RTNLSGADTGNYLLVASNSAGRVTSVVTKLTVPDPLLRIGPVSQIGDAGQSVTLSVTAVGTALNYQWWKDSNTLPQATNSALTLTNLQAADAGRYSVVVSNQYGVTRAG